MRCFEFIVVNLEIKLLKLKSRYCPITKSLAWKETVSDMEKKGISLEWEDDAMRYVAIGPDGQRRYGETELDAAYYLLKSFPGIVKKEN